MTRMKTLAIGATATAMILGSSIVFAAGPEDQTASDTTAEPAAATAIELADPAPAPKRGGGGSGKALKK